MSNASVANIYRYPVKSMMGEALSEADIGEFGIAGDRGWAVRDEKRGGIRGGKKIPQLMTLAAQSGPAAPLITAPDGDSASASSEGINEWLSDKLNHPVTLWPLLPAEQLDHYRRGAPDTEDFEQELRAVFGRLPDEPLPDLTGFEELLEFESPPGTYFDAFPISVMSQQSLATMNQLNGDSLFDVRRFRPNLLVDISGSDHPFPEQAWVGKTLSIGSVKLKIEMTCPRCSMTTHGFDDLPQDAQIMRKLVANSEGNLGTYASVVQAGKVFAGDSVSVV
ncbi:MAG: MOSC domain-containing protein [Halieaceae bacterium]|nr:MAG: MOSC domain-containing protein [Halieaceae bacterium]|tara:strand:+ start:981 stop:1817 length:837 start_codon:yes stop_codon:yes gene_type:complete